MAETKQWICRLVQHRRELDVERVDGLARPRRTTKLPEWKMHVDAMLSQVLPLPATNRGANLRAKSGPEEGPYDKPEEGPL